MKKFSDVTILVEGNKFPFTVSWFKKGKSKITEEEYSNYLYSNVINFDLFYIGYCKRYDCFKPSIDFSSKLGMLRIISTR